MNAISKALYDIRFSIPKQLLELTFINDNPIDNRVIESLDSLITNMVIKPKVLVDCNLVGGITIDVRLSECEVMRHDNNTSLIRVPKQLTGNKSIISLLSIVSSNVVGTNLPVGYHNPTLATNQLTQAAMRMYNNISYANVPQTTNMQIVGDNTIYVYSGWFNIRDGILNCIVENDTNYENLPPKLYPMFSKLCILAVQSYIYNTLYIRLGEGQIYGGHNLGQVKEIVDNYRDSLENYNEFLNQEWGNMIIHGDRKSLNRLIRYMVGNNL